MKQNNRPLGWTTLEEAQQLVEAGLPVETADMHYLNYGTDYGGKKFKVLPFSYVDISTKVRSCVIPCWSLGALMKLMPLEIKICKQTDDIFIYYYIEFENRITYLSSERHKELVDACVEMILKLYELKML